MLCSRKTSKTGNNENDRALSRERTVKICKLGFENVKP